MKLGEVAILTDWLILLCTFEASLIKKEYR